MNKYGYVYKTTNLVNGKIYIGKKKGDFVSNYFGSGIRINNALKKYGRTVFIVEKLVDAEDLEKLNMLEKKYIAEYKSLLGKERCYNIASGGDGGALFQAFGSDNPMYGRRGEDSPSFGKKALEETKRKQRVAAKNRVEKVVAAQTERLLRGRALRKELGPVGRKHMYNPTSGKAARVKLEDVDAYKVRGWVLGRIRSYGGFKKGNKAYMLRKENGMKGRTGEKHPRFGKRHTEESNQKNREKHLGKRAWNKGLRKKEGVWV